MGRNNSLFVVKFAREVARGVFVPKADGTSEQDGLRLVRYSTKQVDVAVSERVSLGSQESGHTTKEQPECTPPYLAFNRVKSLVRRLFVHS